MAALGLSGAALAVGAVIADWRARGLLHEEIVQERTELRQLLADIQAVHNDLATQMGVLGDKVTAHEFQLANVRSQQKSPFAGIRQ